MDIAALSSSMAMSDLGNEIATRVLAMSMDDVQNLGDGLQKMMEQSVNPGVGANIDVSL